jgi:hypothetical protein
MPEEPKPKQVVILDATDWVAFRWSIALDVLSIFNADNIEAAKHAISVLKAADDKITIEWR